MVVSFNSAGVGKVEDVEVMKRLLKYFKLTDCLNMVNLAKGTTMKDVTLKSGDIQGFNYVLIHLVNGRGMGTLLSGRNAEQRALVQQWLQYNLLHLTEKAAITEYVLRDLDSFLVPCAFFAGHNLTLADPVIYISLYPVFIEMGFQEKEKYPNLSRWFRLIQEDTELRGKNKKILFSPMPLYSSTSLH